MARLYGPGPAPPPPLVATTDLSGLSTSDVEGAPVGELVGALSEEETGLIRYLDVSVREAAKHVLVPIGHVRMDRESVPPRVRLRAATQGDLVSIPAFVADETRVDASYHERVMAAHGQLFYGSRYYAHPAYDHARLDDDQATVVGTPTGDTHGLAPLSELEGFRLARGALPLVGDELRDEDGETVGTVHDLLVEVEARRTRYVVVRMEAPDRSTVLPMGYVEPGDDGEPARVYALTRDDIRLLPPYEPPLTRQEENRLHAAIEGRLTGDRYFERPDFRGTT